MTFFNHVLSLASGPDPLVPQVRDPQGRAAFRVESLVPLGG